MHICVYVYIYFVLNIICVYVADTAKIGVE